MSIDTVKAYFQPLGLAHRILEFDVSSATVELAAAAIGCEGAHIAKTMSFLLDGGAILVVTAGDMKVDNRKFKQTFGTKAKMPAAEDLPALVGHTAGGVCPFARKEGVRVYLDISLKRFDTLYPACGSANSAIGLSLLELEAHSGCTAWVDVCVPRATAG